ncbi:MAG: hypothetical protein LBL18_01260 [Bacteroidales bacterium]|nr:hypothetical protein [Bacteroidales bacterium]
MRHCILTLFLGFSLGICAWAQTPKYRPLRIELETAKDADDYHFATAGKAGVYIFYESENIGKDSSVWIFIHYDTNLQRIATFQLPVRSRYAYSYVCETQSHIFILLQETSVSKSSGVSSAVIRVNVSDDSVETCEIGALPHLTVRDMKVINSNHLLLLLSDEKYDEVFYINLADKQLFKPDLPEKSISIVNFMTVDTMQKQVLSGMITMQDKQAYLGLYITDYQGKIIDIQFFPAVKDFFYNNAQLTIIDSAIYLIIGTYSTSETKFSSNIHSGVYSLRYRDGRFEQPHFFNYADLKTEDAAGRKSTPPSPAPSGANMYTLPSPLFTDSTHILFLTELYYPEYTTTSTYSTYDPYSYGRTPAYTNSFSGYRYVNAYVTAFDTAGKLSWNYYFPFQNLITYRLMQRLSVVFWGEETLLYYPFNTYITATLLHNSITIEPITTTTLETSFARDVVEYSRDAHITHWYGNNFLCSGYQYIRNSTKGVKPKRYVFYLNKLAYK